MAASTPAMQAGLEKIRPSSRFWPSEPVEKFSEVPLYHQPGLRFPPLS
jgi:hypothetical protein